MNRNVDRGKGNRYIINPRDFDIFVRCFRICVCHRCPCPHYCRFALLWYQQSMRVLLWICLCWSSPLMLLCPSLVHEQLPLFWSSFSAFISLVRCCDKWMSECWSVEGKSPENAEWFSSHNSHSRHVESRLVLAKKQNKKYHICTLYQIKVEFLSSKLLGSANANQFFPSSFLPSLHSCIYHMIQAQREKSSYKTFTTTFLPFPCCIFGTTMCRMPFFKLACTPSWSILCANEKLLSNVPTWRSEIQYLGSACCAWCACACCACGGVTTTLTSAADVTGGVAGVDDNGVSTSS